MHLSYDWREWKEERQEKKMEGGPGKNRAVLILYEKGCHFTAFSRLW